MEPYWGKISRLANTNIAVNEGINKAKASWGCNKTQSTPRQRSKNKIKTDLSNAAVNSITKYSMATINGSKLTDGKMQKFTSKSIRQIIIGKHDNGNGGNRVENYNIRRGDKIPTICSQLQ